MGDLRLSNVVNGTALHDELRAIKDSHTAAAGIFLDWIEAHDLDIVEGFIPYCESLADGYDGRDGKVHTFKSSGHNARIAAAVHRIMYAFDRSPDSGDLTKRAQLMAYTSMAKRKQVQRAPIREDKYLLWPDVLKVIRELPEVDPRLAKVFEFLARTGVRIDELVNIRLTDITMNGVAIVHVRGKGSKERDVAVERKFIESCIEFHASKVWLFEPSQRHGEPRPFNKISLSNRIKHATAVILGHSVTAHGLRHSYALHAIKDLALTPKAVANQLGHSSTSITMDFYVDDAPSGDLMALMSGPTDAELSAQAKAFEREMSDLGDEKAKL